MISSLNRRNFKKCSTSWRIRWVFSKIKNPKNQIWWGLAANKRSNLYMNLILMKACRLNMTMRWKIFKFSFQIKEQYWRNMNIPSRGLNLNLNYSILFVLDFRDKYLVRWKILVFRRTLTVHKWHIDLIVIQKKLNLFQRWRCCVLTTNV